MRHEKTRNGCKDDENICRSPPEGRPCPGPEPLQEVAEAEENSGMEGRDKHGEQQRQRIHLQQDTQAVGRSGCFLFHSDSVARMGILSQEIVASGKSPRPSGGKANPRVITSPITGSIYIESGLELVSTLDKLGSDPSRAGYWFRQCEEIANRELVLCDSNLRLAIARLYPALESSNLPGMPTNSKPQAGDGILSFLDKVFGRDDPPVPILLRWPLKL